MKKTEILTALHKIIEKDQHDEQELPAGSERIHGRDRQKDTNTVYIKMIWERRWL